MTLTSPERLRATVPVVGQSPLLVDDVTTRPELEALAATADFGIRSYAGVALRDADGTVFGTLCAIGHARHHTLNLRDGKVLEGLAEVVAPLLAAGLIAAANATMYAVKQG